MIKNISWTLRGGRVLQPSPFALFGIVNLTPDSFSDGGKYQAPEQALAHARLLWQEGAQILDLGAESSRPGAEPLDGGEEGARLMPVLQALLHAEADFWTKSPVQGGSEQVMVGQDATEQDSPKHEPAEQAPLQQAPLLSVDTYHASTAAAVLQAGVPIINDISAALFEPELLDVVAQYKPGYVLMHSSGRPYSMQKHIPDGPIMPYLQDFFEKQLHRFTKAGLPEEHILLDPGIGFGKSVEQNWEILRSLHQLEHFGRPILAALSMKSFLHKQLGMAEQDMHARAEATHITTALLGAQGIVYHRVHHVARSRRALSIASGLAPC